MQVSFSCNDVRESVRYVTVFEMRWDSLFAMITDTVFFWANSNRLEWARLLVEHEPWIEVVQRACNLHSLGSLLVDVVAIKVICKNHFAAEIVVREPKYIDLTITRFMVDSLSCEMECLYASQQEAVDIPEATLTLKEFMNYFIKLSNNEKVSPFLNANRRESMDVNSSIVHWDIDDRNRALLNRELSDSTEEWARVGRWMSKEEYEKIVITKHTIQSILLEEVNVAYPPEPSAFIHQAHSGTYYVEFEVPKASIFSRSFGWATLRPTALESRIRLLKSLSVPGSPPVRNIRHLATRLYLPQSYDQTTQPQMGVHAHTGEGQISSRLSHSSLPDALLFWANTSRLKWASKGLWVEIARRTTNLANVDPSLGDVVVITVIYQDRFYAEIVVRESVYIDLTIAKSSTDLVPYESECVYAHHQEALGSEQAVQIAEGFIEYFMSLSGIR